MVILQTVTPIDPLLQKVIHTFYGPKSLAWFAKFSIAGESIMVNFCYLCYLTII